LRTNDRSSDPRFGLTPEDELQLEAEGAQTRDDEAPAARSLRLFETGRVLDAVRLLRKAGYCAPDVARLAAQCTRIDFPKLRGRLTRAGFSTTETRRAATAFAEERSLPSDAEILLAVVPTRDDRRGCDTGDYDLSSAGPMCWTQIVKMNDPPFVFELGNTAVTVLGQRGEPRVEALERTRMAHVLARAVYFYRVTKAGAFAAPPPPPLVADLLVSPMPPIPFLERVTRVPVVARTGEIVMSPGYHDSGLYYFPLDGLRVPLVLERPTGYEIAQARQLIVDELLGDFPFASQPDRAHAVALFLLPFVRDLIRGPTPLHLIEKPTPGTGATLLVHVLLGLGAPTSQLTEAANEEEWRKKLTAKFLTMPELIFIDNLRRPLDSAALSAALTADEWEDRILGVSKVARIPLRCTYVATGNNPSLSNEIARRSVRIRMDAGVQQPFLRQGFRHELPGWALEHRGELIWAALTLARAWLAAGRRDAGKRLGMFDEWAKVMGGLLEVAEIPGFLDNTAEFYARTDFETTRWEAFVTEWAQQYETRTVGTADLFSIAEQHLDLGDGDPQARRTSLGRQLGQYRDRVFGSHRIVHAGVKQNAAQYCLLSPESE
jgi:putative DNA primase/helicase